VDYIKLITFFTLIRMNGLYVESRTAVSAKIILTVTLLLIGIFNSQAQLASDNKEQTWKIIRN
jgi:hypothetical protein